MLYKTLLKMGLVTAFWLVADPMREGSWGLLGLRELLSGIVFGRRRERRRTTCSACTGTGVCTTCNGKGCARCNGDGRCAQCHGEGNLITGSGSENANG